MKKLIKFIIIYLFLFVLSFSIGFAINCFVKNNFVFELNYNLIFDMKTITYSLEIFLIIFIVRFYKWSKKVGAVCKKDLMQISDEDKYILSGLEQAHFQSEKEKQKNFLQVDFEQLENKNICGIPISAQLIKNKMQITFASSAHTLVIGTTGSGKTTSFINPTIQILSKTKDKPSMLIADPKGELYALHYKSLKDKGYDVKVLDLRNPYCSIRWNPLEKPFNRYQEMLELSKQEQTAMLQIKMQEIFDEVYEDLHDIISVICPVINKSEPIWESGAKNFILAIALAMLEDSENKNLGMTKERFNFYNLMKIATNTQKNCLELIKYFKGRSPISKSVNLSKQVLDASDKTRGSYLSTIFDKLAMFSDMSICSLTSANEINFGEIALKPTVLFLQIPDEKETRHPLASMAILQAYKELVAKANSYADLTLPRDVYFLLDEFGNLPRIHKLEQMITVGRSRKIWLSLVIQSYAQLSKVYDSLSADIIKANCNIQIFIGTTDLKTIEDFSKLCGNYSIIQKSASFNSGSANVNSSASIRERPLIYPSELQQLNNNSNMGNAIVNVFGFPPLKSKFTPSYKCNKYNLIKTNQLLNMGNFFDEKNVFYDIEKRNKIILKKKKQPFEEWLNNGKKENKNEN